MYLALKSTPMSGAQVAAVTQRLATLGYLAAASSSYTKPVADAVTKFQGAMGIRKDGVVGPQTLACLVCAELARRSPTLTGGVFLMAIVWNESGFYPSSARNASGAKIADNASDAVRYGLFLLSPKLPGNVRVDLPIGTVQTDAQVAKGIAGIESQWNAGASVFNALTQGVMGPIGGPEARIRPEDGPFLRLLALAHKLSGDPSCLGPILSAPAVVGLRWAWPAIVKLSADQAASSSACAKAFALAIGSGYVDRVITKAQALATAFGRADLAAQIGDTGTLVINRNPATTTTSQPTPPEPAAQPGGDEPPPEPATAPPESEGKLPVSQNEGAAPPPTTLPPTTIVTPPRVQTAGPSSGGGGAAVLLVIAAIVLALSSKGGGGSKSKGKARR